MYHTLNRAMPPKSKTSAADAPASAAEKPKLAASEAAAADQLPAPAGNLSQNTRALPLPLSLKFTSIQFSLNPLFCAEGPTVNGAMPPKSKTSAADAPASAAEKPKLAASEAAAADQLPAPPGNLSQNTRALPLPLSLKFTSIQFSLNPLFLCRSCA
jgi:hypothetical protein